MLRPRRVTICNHPRWLAYPREGCPEGFVASVVTLWRRWSVACKMREQRWQTTAMAYCLIRMLLPSSHENGVVKKNSKDQRMFRSLEERVYALCGFARRDQSESVCARTTTRLATAAHATGAIDGAEAGGSIRKVGSVHPIAVHSVKLWRLLKTACTPGDGVAYAMHSHNTSMSQSVCEPSVCERVCGACVRFSLLLRTRLFFSPLPKKERRIKRGTQNKQGERVE